MACDQQTDKFLWISKGNKKNDFSLAVKYFYNLAAQNEKGKTV